MSLGSKLVPCVVDPPPLHLRPLLQVRHLLERVGAVFTLEHSRAIFHFVHSGAV